MVPGDRMTLPPLGSAPTLLALFSFSHRSAGDEACRSDRFVQLIKPSFCLLRIFDVTFVSSMSLIVFLPLRDYGKYFTIPRLQGT
jgi:hypothetical protein